LRAIRSLRYGRRDPASGRAGRPDRHQELRVNATSPDIDPTEATPAQRRRWAQYLSDERAEAATYRRLARRREGDERDILEQLEQAERRHEQHWLALLGGEPKRLPKPTMRTRVTA